MRIGASFFIDRSLDDIARRLQWLEELGYDTVWVPQIFGWDTLTALAVAGRSTERIEIGTAVVPTYPRHPVMLAAEALTVSAALGGRLALGIGLSHKIVIDDMLGLSFDKPAVHTAGITLLSQGHSCGSARSSTRVRRCGRRSGCRCPPTFRRRLSTSRPWLTTCCASAGSMADGTILWMTGPATVEQHIVPLVTKAAADAARWAPRVVVGLPMRLTSDPAGAREEANRDFVIYGQLPPSYRATLDLGGRGQPGRHRDCRR